MLLNSLNHFEKYDPESNLVRCQGVWSFITAASGPIGPSQKDPQTRYKMRCTLIPMGNLTPFHGALQQIALSNSERKQAMSTHYPQHAQPQSSTFMDVVRIILAIILPPVGVLMQVGLGMHFWLNIVLTLCGYIPGLVHAVWVIAKK